MITIHDCSQLSDEWFLKRCGSLGGSAISKAIAQGAGKSRKTLAYQLAAESVTGAKTEIRTTPAMQWGIDTEPAARSWFEFMQGVEVREVGLITNDDFPGCHASPDGLISDNSGFECKCPQPATHVKNLDTGKVPPEYKAQVQFSMLISDRQSWWFLSYHPDFNKQLLIQVKRDELYLDKMQSLLRMFFSELEVIKEKIK